MSTTADRDYVLGTNDEELARLRLQHEIWRPTVLGCWRRAGIVPGWQVLDVGAGPGNASVDLSELVGPSGAVVAVERLTRFVQAGRAWCASRGVANVRYEERDLMTDPLPPGAFDASWCRWVASFVSSPRMLVAKLAGAIRSGRVAIFHEYVDYGSWRFAPTLPRVEEFVQQVMKSWRASGGEPDIAPAVASFLTEYGFRIRETTPRIFCVGPDDPIWRWPAAFLYVNLRRLRELGSIDEHWAQRVRTEFETAAANPSTLMITPMVLEIIAQRT